MSTTNIHAAIVRIREIAKGFGFDSDFDLPSADSDCSTLATLRFSTRENGDVGEGTPGAADIQAAKGFRAAIRDEFNIKVALDTCDEWVEADIELVDLQSALNLSPTTLPAAPRPRS